MKLWGIRQNLPSAGSISYYQMIGPVNRAKYNGSMRKANIQNSGKNELKVSLKRL